MSLSRLSLVTSFSMVDALDSLNTVPSLKREITDSSSLSLPLPERLEVDRARVRVRVFLFCLPEYELSKGSLSMMTKPRNCESVNNTRCKIVEISFCLPPCPPCHDRYGALAYIGPYRDQKSSFRALQTPTSSCLHLSDPK